MADTSQQFSTLKTIIPNLGQIRRQSRLLTIAFSNLNKDKVDGCVDRLAVALEKFGVNISNSIVNALCIYLLHRLETTCTKPRHLKTSRSS